MNKLLVISLLILLLGCTQQSIQLSDLPELSETNASGLPDLGELPDTSFDVGNFSSGLIGNPFPSEPIIN